MKLFGAAALLLALCALYVTVTVHGNTDSHRHILHTRDAAPLEWIQQSRASPDSTVEFTLALKQLNLDKLDALFWEVSDPKHENYQAYKSIDEINQLIAPSTAEMKQVRSWLTSHGVVASSIKSLGDALEVKTTVAHAEKLFHTQFYNFHHRTTKAKVVRSFGAYSVPASLKHLILMVSGLSSFPIPHLKMHRPPRRDVEVFDAAVGVIPQTLDTQYSIPPEYRDQQAKFSAAPLTTQGVVQFAFITPNFLPADLVQYGEWLNLTVQSIPPQNIIGGGVNDPTQPGGEPTMDIQLLSGMSRFSSEYFWITAGSGWMYEFALSLANTPNAPLVNSISYAWWEEDQCHFNPSECTQLGVNNVGYVERVNVEFQKIGLRGMTLVAGSGDDGAMGSGNMMCSYPQLRPEFPSTSPYVTSVGATQLADYTSLPVQLEICQQANVTCLQQGTEQAVSFNVSSFASGGGFSNITSRPSYQEAVVASYLASGVALPPSSYYNSSGRAHPDVSTVGWGNVIVYTGTAQAASGTSASTPIFAGLISMLNSESIKLTGKPLGFINPLLYQMAAASPSTFTDVTVGDNICTEDGCSGCEGFQATEGWDPVTGLGTPNFSAMLSYIESEAKQRAVKKQLKKKKAMKH